MKPEKYQQLLKALQKLHKPIAKDLLERCRADGPLADRMHRRFLADEVGGDEDEWLKLACARGAVQLLLRSVYVRVLEDLGLLEPWRLRGQGGFDAFHALAPRLGRRSFLRWVFRDLANDFPALFTSGDDEPGLPAEPLCDALWELWHEQRDGALAYDWRDGDFDSRFLGDLYQDLDASVRKRYAMLQTPDFVERYILDHTLTPALAAFDPQQLQERRETFRLLDPACGSGHFLLGAFARLLAYWTARSPALPVGERIQRALDAVWGADINGYAVAVARFRLLLAARAAARAEGTPLGLAELAALRLNLVTADSLVPWEGVRGQLGLGEAVPGSVEHRIANYATPAERRHNAAFFGHAFHAVVGNPPFITPKDPAKRDAYRLFWPQSCHMQYALSVPFAERLFRLAADNGFVGQITGNSFLKREFGKPLVEAVLPKLDITHVVDTSGAYIPAHGTPTLILFGRNRRPATSTVSAILGIRGEPSRPQRPDEGLVWQSILRNSSATDGRDEFTSAVTLRRSILSKHPWSLGGAGGVELGQRIAGAGSTTLEARLATQIGSQLITGEDTLYTASASEWRRAGADKCNLLRGFVEGEQVRDFTINAGTRVLVPMESLTGAVVEPSALGDALPRFWRAKSLLRRRVVSGSTSMEEAGRRWYDVRRLSRDKSRTERSLTFAFVATHNHFVLDRGGKVFNRSAPVVKLKATAKEDDYLDLLGLLNSSTLGFWMRQVFHDKGNRGTGGGIVAEAWERFYEYDATKLKQAPLVTADRPARVALAKRLDELAAMRARRLPAAVLGEWPAGAPPLAARLAAAAAEHGRLTEQLVALQEELDWLTYGSYGLLEAVEVAAAAEAGALAPGHRPFEIALARKQAAGEIATRYFERHARAPVTEVPARYSGAERRRIEERLALLADDDNLALLEQPEFKRRFVPVDWPAETKKAAEAWLLDRLEDLFAPGGALAAPRPYALEAIVAALRPDPRVAEVAGLWAGSANAQLGEVVEALLLAEALPDNPLRLCSDEGLRKLARWRWTWALQDQEDAYEAAAKAAAARGETVPPLRLRDPDTDGELAAIPLPPKFAADDFVRPAYFKIRGKLNVPRERFIVFADLDPVGYGWNGWRNDERAEAATQALAEAQRHPQQPLVKPPTKADPRRCGPTLGLWASLEDVRRWGSREFHEELTFIARGACGQRTCPCEVSEAWRAWRASGGRPGAAAPARTTAARWDQAIQAELDL